MDNIIDFQTIKKEKLNKQINEYLKRPNSLSDVQKIEKLLEEKKLTIEDHQFFLSFLAYLEKQKIDPIHLFQSLIKLPKHEFQNQFEINWKAVVQFCFTFLAILKKSEPKQFEEFIELQKFD